MIRSLSHQNVWKERSDQNGWQNLERRISSTSQSWRFSCRTKCGHKHRSTKHLPLVEINKQLGGWNKQLKIRPFGHLETNGVWIKGTFFTVCLVKSPLNGSWYSFGPLTLSLCKSSSRDFTILLYVFSKYIYIRIYLYKGVSIQIDTLIFHCTIMWVKHGQTINHPPVSGAPNPNGTRNLGWIMGDKPWIVGKNPMN